MGAITTSTYVKQQFNTAQITCPVQILVIDHDNGPAELLMDTVSRLVSAEVVITHIDDASDAMRIMEHSPYDLVVVGLEHRGAEPLAMMPYIRVQHPNIPVVAVGHIIRKADKACAEHFKINDVLRLPTRARKMKSVASYIACRYLE